MTLKNIRNNGMLRHSTCGIEINHELVKNTAFRTVVCSVDSIFRMENKHNDNDNGVDEFSRISRTYAVCLVIYCHVLVLYAQFNKLYGRCWLSFWSAPT